MIIPLSLENHTKQNKTKNNFQQSTNSFAIKLPENRRNQRTHVRIIKINKDSSKQDYFQQRLTFLFRILYWVNNHYSSCNTCKRIWIRTNILSTCFVYFVNNFSNKSEIMRHRMSIDFKIFIKFGTVILIDTARELQFWRYLVHIKC